MENLLVERARAPDPGENLHFRHGMDRRQDQYKLEAVCGLTYWQASCMRFADIIAPGQIGQRMMIIDKFDEFGEKVKESDNGSYIQRQQAVSVAAVLKRECKSHHESKKRKLEWAEQNGILTYNHNARMELVCHVFFAMAKPKRGWKMNDVVKRKQFVRKIALRWMELQHGLNLIRGSDTRTDHHSPPR